MLTKCFGAVRKPVLFLIGPRELELLRVASMSPGSQIDHTTSMAFGATRTILFYLWMVSLASFVKYYV